MLRLPGNCQYNYNHCSENRGDSITISREKHDSIQEALYRCELVSAQANFYEGFYQQNVILDSIVKHQEKEIQCMRTINDLSLKISTNYDKSIVEYRREIKIKNWAFKLSFGAFIISGAILIGKIF